MREIGTEHMILNIITLCSISHSKFEQNGIDYRMENQGYRQQYTIPFILYTIP